MIWTLEQVEFLLSEKGRKAAKELEPYAADPYRLIKAAQEYATGQEFSDDEVKSRMLNAGVAGAVGAGALAVGIPSTPLAVGAHVAAVAGVGGLVRRRRAPAATG